MANTTVYPFGQNGILPSGYSAEISKLNSEVNYPPEVYTDITADATVADGYTLSSTPETFNVGEGRSVRYLAAYAYNKRIKKLRVTANANFAEAFAFAKAYWPSASDAEQYGYKLAEGETGIRVATAGESIEVEVPRNTLFIIFNNATSSQQLFATKIEAMFAEMDGGSLTDGLRIDAQKSYLLNISEGRYYNREIVFTKKDVRVGDILNITMSLPDSAVKADLCYLALYDGNGQILWYAGKGSTAVNPEASYSASGKITSDFEYAGMVCSLAGGCTISIENDILNSNAKTGGTHSYGNYTEVNLANCSSASDVYINGKVWATSGNTGRIWKIVPVPAGAKYLSIRSDWQNAVLFLHDYDAPANNLMPDYADVEKQLYSLQNDDVFLPAGTKYVLIQTHNTTDDISPSYVGFAETRPSITGGVDEAIDDYVVGREIEDVSCPDSADVVLSTTDEDATSHDNALLGYFSVVKISDSLFYMYYSCLGKSETFVNDNSQHLAFAYSTDGVNWTRGIPEGIEAPNPGTNLLFTEKVLGVQVFKVPDNEFPFRMLASYNRDETVMYKSADGVNFTKIRTVFPYYCDNQVSCIVRGNIVKVYIRWRSDINGESTVSSDYRFIGVCTLDIDGNVIAPPTTFFGLNLYQASASILDDRREIAFPTRYLPTPSDTQSIQCFIIDGKKVYRRDFDTANLIANDELSFYVAPGLVDIGGEMYLYMSARTAKHNSFSQATTVCRIKRVRVQFDVEGRAWIYKA